MDEPRISVIIRARDEAASIGRCLELLGAQQLPAGWSAPEVIVVDDQSRDATAEIARRHGARVLTIPHGEFSFGRALNLGAAAAGGELLVALSAHAFPPDPGWLARLAAALTGDPAVACACGERFRPDGSRLQGAFRYDAAAAARWPEWGYSNAAGGFRASLWRERGFREDLPGCEDREWGRWATSRGYACVLDPALLVEHDHTHDPLASIYRRARRESQALSMFLAGRPRPALSASVREWWSDTRFYASPWRARLSHRRLARIAGAHAGARRAERIQRGGSSPNGTRRTRRLA